MVPCLGFLWGLRSVVLRVVEPRPWSSLLPLHPAERQINGWQTAGGNFTHSRRRFIDGGWQCVIGSQLPFRPPPSVRSPILLRPINLYYALHRIPLYMGSAQDLSVDVHCPGSALNQDCRRA